MPVYLQGDCGCGGYALAGTRSARSRLVRSKLLGSALGAAAVAPAGRVCPAWGCGPAPITRISIPRVTAPASTTSTSSSSASTPTNTLRSRRNRLRRVGAQTGSPSTAYGSTVQNYDASGNPVYSVAPQGQSIVGYDAQGNPVYGSNQSVAAPAPASVSVSTPATTSDYQSILDWFTDPTQELIGGVQNWILIAALGGGYLLLTRSRGGRR